MLRMSKLTDYGLVLMSHVAAGAPGTVHQSRDLAAAAGLPLATVSKLLKQLQRGGLLMSLRGLNGGYLLARPAAEVTLAEVVAALEGPIALTDCQATDHDQCQLERSCPVRGTWRSLNRTLLDALSGVTLATLAPPARRVRDRAAARRGVGRNAPALAGSPASPEVKLP